MSKQIQEARTVLSTARRELEIALENWKQVCAKGCSKETEVWLWDRLGNAYHEVSASRTFLLQLEEKEPVNKALDEFYEAGHRSGR